MDLNFKPFTKNIIFLDTEFSSNDPYTSETLSLGLIKMSGEELYLEIDQKNEVSEWVQENILPTLTQEKVSREKAIKKIIDFVGRDTPYVISNVYLYDIVDLHKLFGSKSIKDLPFHWLPLDIASMFFALGKDPYSLKDKNFLKEIGIDTDKFKHTHNALEDARLLKEVYLKLIQ